MRIRRLFAVLSLSFVVAACGTQNPALNAGPTPSGSGEITPAATATASPATTTTPTTNPKPSPTPTLVGSHTLTEADAGRTIVLKVGQTIQVKLGSEYHVPEAQDDAVTRTSSSGGYPTGQPAMATFKAVKPGNADISSTTDYACLHSTPACMVPQQLWVVHVKIT